MIRNKIRDQYGILLTSKDISNITQSERSLDGNNLRTFQQLLHDKYGCITKVKASDRNEFEALFFTNSDMQKSVTNWPEILFVDGTYKLFNLRYTLYLLIIQNGNGRGEIGGVAITASETAHVLEWIAKTFRENNSKACQNTKCIMTDKGLTERKAFEAVFPGIKCLLCLFHTLKSFDKHTEKSKL
ncbi:zinc finger SWIM domain-containing protein 3-like [Cotesia typhae]|uniref:zinc finger SWIM domain-containing protein 3-like n=1 Tax=Cotesia typhae TaxID=2053667 RepID=UPI003D692C40